MHYYSDCHSFLLDNGTFLSAI